MRMWNRKSLFDMETAQIIRDGRVESQQRRTSSMTEAEHPRKPQDRGRPGEV